jgi:hypothetical protein
MECLTDANDKANHTLHTTTGKVQAAEWFGTTPDVSLFQPVGQHGYVTNALKSEPGAKLRPRAYRARYMSRVGFDFYRLCIETTTPNGVNTRPFFRTIRAANFVPYRTSTDRVVQVRTETFPSLVQTQQPPPQSQSAPTPEISNDDETQAAAALNAILVDDRICIAENVAANLAAAHPDLPPDPRTLNEAKPSEHHKACTSYDKGLSKLEDCGTYLPYDLPAGAPLLDYVTVFRVKMDAAGAVTERKTRIKKNGAQQQEGLHFDPDKLYAPFADRDCIRLAIAAAAMEILEVRH